jgi:hypothetical protein
MRKQVTVHSGDQFPTFNNRRFSLPSALPGRSVWARYAVPRLQLYDNKRLIRQYVVHPQIHRYWQPEDFPAEVREMMNGGYPAWLIEKANALRLDQMDSSAIRLISTNGKSYRREIMGNATRSTAKSTEKVPRHDPCLPQSSLVAGHQREGCSQSFSGFLTTRPRSLWITPRTIVDQQDSPGVENMMTLDRSQAVGLDLKAKSGLEMIARNNSENDKRMSKLYDNVKIKESSF